MKNKKWFMNQLKKRLIGKFAMEDVKDILSDYEEFFDVASEKGKSEEELIKELGDPRIIAKNIGQEWKQEKKRVVVPGNIVQYGIRIFYICALLFYVSIIKSRDDWGTTVFIALPLTFVGFWSFFGGRLSSFHSVSKKSDVQKRRTKFLFLHGGQVLLTLPIFAVILGLFFTPNKIMDMFHGDIEKIGPLIVKCISVLCVIILGYSIWAIDQFRKGSIEYYGLFFHGFTSIVMSLDFINILHRMTSLDIFIKLLLRPLLLYAEGILLILLFLLLIKKMQKEVE